MHKALGRFREQSKRHLSKRSIMTECKRPIPKSSPATPATPPRRSTPSCSPTEKYISPFCRHKSSSTHQDMSRLSHPSPFFIAEESPSSGICRKKVPPSSLKLPTSLLSLKFSNFSKQKCRSLYDAYFSPRSRFYCAAVRPARPQACLQDACRSLPGLRRGDKMREESIHNGPVSPRGAHRRGFRSSLPLAESKSDKPAACQETTKTTAEKKIDRCGQSCEEKMDVCREKKVKCDKRLDKKDDARQKVKTERKSAGEAACKKTCFGKSKCELPHTAPPPKMQYAKVKCASPKLAKPNQCSSTLDLGKSGARVEAKQGRQIQKTQICEPPPMPKPPCGPIVLCPCPPPSKQHPGPCPRYEMRREVARPSTMPPCAPKKKYPCPTAVHICAFEKKPCKLKRDQSCEGRQRKGTPAS